MLISKKSGKLITVTALVVFFSNMLLIPYVSAYERDYKNQFLVDSFVEDIQKHLEGFRDIEADYNAPIEKSDLNMIEDLYKDQFSLIENELIRLEKAELNQHERLEIESVLIEINLQIQRSLDEIEDKINNSIDDEFNEMSLSFLEESLEYQDSLTNVLESKLDSPAVTISGTLAEVKKTTKELSVVVDYLENIADEFDDLEQNLSGITATTSNFTTIYDEAYEDIEDAENELRKLDYVSSGDITKLRKSIKQIDRNFDDFLDEFENTFKSTFEDRTRDAVDILSNGLDQVNKAYSDVKSSRNTIDLSVYDALEKIRAIIEESHSYRETFPDFEIGLLIEKLEDFLNDDEDEDDTDLIESVDELKEDSSAYASLYEDDLEDDLGYFVEEIIDGLNRISRGTYRTSVIDVNAAILALETEVSAIENNLDTVLNETKEIESVEEDIQEIVDRAESYILELRLRPFSDIEEATIVAQVNSLSTAVSSTYDEIKDRTPSLTSYVDELEFDLFGTGDGNIATTEYSMFTDVYETIVEVQAGTGDGQTTPANIMTFIDTKLSSLSSIEAGWGSNITSDTIYRDAEESLVDVLDEIEFEIFRLIEGATVPLYSFDTTISSAVIANNIGNHYVNMINKAEDVIDMIQSSISSDENDDLEDLIEDLYKEIDDSVALLKDAMTSSIISEHTDILADIEDEKDRLDRTFNSLSISSSSSTNNAKTIKNIEDDFSEQIADLSDIIGNIPDDLNSYSDFEDMEDDILDLLVNTQKTIKNIYSQTFSYDDFLSIHQSFKDVLVKYYIFLVDLQKKSGSRVRGNQRTLERAVRKSIIEFKIIFDNAGIEAYEYDDGDDYSSSKNLSSLSRKVNDVNYTPNSLTDIDDYHEELGGFRSKYRLLEDELNILIENKPELDESDTTNLEQYYESFDDNWSSAIKSFEDIILDEDDIDYLEDSFNTYVARYYTVLNSLFYSSLNGYSAVTYEFEEIYPETNLETEKPPTEEKEPLPKREQTEFSDVGKENVFSSYINALTEEGAISGYEDGSFQPSRSITRAEFVKVAIGVMNVENKDLSSKNLSFNDIDKENVFAPYIGYAVEKGYINGYNENSFGPDDKITRIDAIRILIRMLNLSSTDTPTTSEYFSDINTADLATLTDRVYKAELISGYEDGTFKPYNAITRGEASKILVNAFLEN